MESLLHPYRVLDLTDDKGFLCGKLLADLGAEVIKVEPPGGEPARLVGPFVQDVPDPQGSLFWFAYNQGKKGITLNLKVPEGQDIFRRLLATAQVVVESFPPGYLEGLGLGYGALSETRQDLVFTSITPFGQDGPYRDLKAPDIVGMALGGYMYLCGDPDRAPVRIGFPQAYLHAAAEAAVGTMLALYHRGRTGQGQRVDVSMQESVAGLLMNSRGYWDILRVNLGRQGSRRAGLSSGAVQRQTWPCRDGFVTFVVFGSASGARTNQALVQWMEEEGLADDFLRGMDWDAFDMATASQEIHDQLEERIGRFFLAHTRRELFQGAIQRRIMLYPVATISDLLEDPQLAARDYWRPVEHPELGSRLPYPGPFVQASLTHCLTGRRAPLIGEDNEEIYGKKLGLGREELIDLRRRGVI